MKEIRRYITRISRIAQVYQQRSLREVDVTPTEVTALRTLIHHKTMNQTELANHLEIDKAAVTRIIASLERKKYLIRTQDPTDGRMKRIEPLPPAFEIKQAAISAEDTFFEWLLEELSPQEIEQLVPVLERLFHRALAARRSRFAELLPSGEGGEEARK